METDQCVSDVYEFRQWTLLFLVYKSECLWSVCCRGNALCFIEESLTKTKNNKDKL